MPPSDRAREPRETERAGRPSGATPPSSRRRRPTRRNRSGRAVHARRARAVRSVDREDRPRERCASRTRIGLAAKGGHPATGRGHRGPSLWDRATDRRAPSSRGAVAARTRSRGTRSQDHRRRARATIGRPARDPPGHAARAATLRAAIASASRTRIGHAATDAPLAIGRGRHARSRMAIAAIGRLDRRAVHRWRVGRRNPGTRSRAHRRSGTSARPEPGPSGPRDGGDAPSRRSRAKARSDRPRGEERRGDRPWPPPPEADSATATIGRRGPPRGECAWRMGQEAVGQEAATARSAGWW